MTPDFNAHSFDRLRERSAPETLTGRWSSGGDATIALTGLTLLVAVKSNCDGCLAFLNAPLDEFGDLDVVFVSAADDTLGEWQRPDRRVLVAPEVLRSLGVTWPPFYVLIEPEARRVLCEGVLFGPSQVAQEIARFLR